MIGNSMPGSGNIAESFSGGYCYGSTGTIAFTGICTSTTIAAHFATTAAPGQGHFEASTAACTNSQAALPAPFLSTPPPVANNPPQQPPAPRPTPPTPVAPKPAAPVAQPVLYCGTFFNVTYQFSGVLQIQVNPGAGFTGAVSVGQALSKTSLTTYGSGTFNGTRNGTSCGGTDTGGLTFDGTCSPTAIQATYSIAGQNGSFNVTTAGCGH
jgi:hypothetical protein